MSRNVRRLFEQFEPEIYKLYLHPDKTTMHFQGSLLLKGVKKGRPSKRIVLHAKKLKITSAQITHLSRHGKSDIVVSRIVFHAGYNEVRLHSDSLIYPGEYEIELNYSAKITRPMEGLYPCYYDRDGKQEVILATQFESHHAREVLPCIDEPEAKAIFELTLVAPSDETVLANTEPISSDELESGLTKYVFAPTPKMSTYLLAFIIGKVEYREAMTKTGVRVRTYARYDLVEHTAFALETATKTLDFYNDYFGIAYPLSKCDLIALPDFASGAMENWGLITFREQGLIVDPLNTSLNMKQYVANVIAHELTHQWFGNLVTMRWWNDLWLNESFASLMSYVAMDALFPEWQIWIQFLVDEQAPALKLDSLEHTHPINVAIHHPDEIRTIFDNISYEKGASVLFMLMHYLGKDDFRAGLMTYLKRHAYGNTVSADLWQAWEETAHKPVSDFMSSWTMQSGYPLLSVKTSSKELSLTQSRFYISPQAKREEAKWPLPLLPSLDIEATLLDAKEKVIHFSAPKATDPLILNTGRSAFYRVVYDQAHLQLITAQLKANHLAFNELDRLGLIADSFEAAKAGLCSTTDALDLLNAYAQEDSEVVWEMIAANIAALRTCVIDDNEALRNSMNPSIHKLIAKQYTRLGWDELESDTHFDKLLRPVILGLACMSNLKAAQEQVEERFAKRDQELIHPDIRPIIYPTIARHGGKAEFETLLKMHNSSTNSEERLALAAALTNFKQPDLIKRALDLITTDKVRLQDVAYWVSDSFANRHAKLATWQWVKDHWTWLEANLGSDLSFFMMPRYVARGFSDLAFLPDFEKFFQDRLSPSFARPLNQAIETITWQALWRERDLKLLKDYYHQN